MILPISLSTSPRLIVSPFTVARTSSALGSALASAFAGASVDLAFAAASALAFFFEEVSAPITAAAAIKEATTTKGRAGFGFMGKEDNAGTPFVRTRGLFCTHTVINYPGHSFALRFANHLPQTL